MSEAFRDAMHRLAEDSGVDVRPTHGFCSSCNEESAITRTGQCLWCGQQTKPLEVHVRPDPHREYVERYGRLHPRLSERQVRAAHRLYMAGWSYRAIAEQIWRRLGFPTRHACMSGLYDAFRRAGLPRRDRALPVRKISDVVAERAHELYEEGRTMAEVAEVLFDSTPHEKVERLEEGLRREFRRRGWGTRSTRESLKGRACRTEKRCAALTNRDRPCRGNVIKRSDGSYGEYCWQHDPSYAERKEAIAHMDRMRARRRWMKELVPMEPFVRWLERRRAELAAELAAKPRNPRNHTRHVGAGRALSEATGIDQSTLSRWVRFQSTKGPKTHITETKVREVLEHDGTTTFEELYGEVGVREAA